MYIVLAQLSTSCDNHRGCLAEMLDILGTLCWGWALERCILQHDISNWQSCTVWYVLNPCLDLCSTWLSGEQVES